MYKLKAAEWRPQHFKWEVADRVGVPRQRSGQRDVTMALIVTNVPRMRRKVSRNMTSTSLTADALFAQKRNISPTLQCTCQVPAEIE